jgi:hypothetical protein
MGISRINQSITAYRSALKVAQGCAGDIGDINGGDEFFIRAAAWRMLLPWRCITSLGPGPYRTFVFVGPYNVSYVS